MSKMIRLSFNLLSAIKNMLKNAEKYKLSSIEELWSINTSQINTEWLIQTIKQCGWILLNRSDEFKLTDKALKIIDEKKDTKHTLRIMLSDYILGFYPVWCYKIPFGRFEAAFLMSEDERACFHEAELLCDYPDDNTVKWWDTLSSVIRKKQEDKRNDCGRAGEKLTLAYEEQRTGVKPKWISIDSNMSGYDVLSQISSEDNSKLLIETKSSRMNLEDAAGYISINEWRTAITAKNYLFYFWIVGPQNMLATIKVTQMAPYMPTNNLSGEWETVRIPFNSFRDMFQIINAEDEE